MKQNRRGRPTGYKLSARSKKQIAASKTGQRQGWRTKKKIAASLVKYFDAKGRVSRKTVLALCSCGSLFETDKYFQRKYCPVCIDNFWKDNGDYLKFHSKIAGRKQYKLWRYKVLIRDECKCRFCGVPTSTVHHIIDILKLKDIPELLYNTDIGVSLCNSCHGRLHAYKRWNK